MDKRLGVKNTLTLGSLFSGSGGFELGGLLTGITPVWNAEVAPFPIRVTTKRLPFVKHYGDVSKIDGREIEPVDIATFGSPCFPTGTLVLTVNGYIPIEDIQIGDKVLTHTGKWQNVISTGSKVSETIILRGNHYGLECTPNHPIYSANSFIDYRRGDDKKYINGHFQLSEKREWTPAENMKGKLWATPRKVDSLELDTDCGFEQNEAFWYLTGRWLGDGWQNRKFTKVCICDGFDDADELIDAVDAVTDNYTIQTLRTEIRITINSEVYSKWLYRNFGKYSHKKFIKPWVYGIDENLRRAFLKGILDTDGNTIQDGYNIATVSESLALSLRILGELEGWTTRIHVNRLHGKKTFIEGREVNQRDWYAVRFSTRTAERKRVHLYDDLHSWYRVRSVEPTGKRQIVYNLTVENDNSYVAESIVVHNCQDLSIAGKRAGINGQRSGLYVEAVRIIKEMLEATNREYPKFCVFENVPGLLSSNKGNDFIACLDMMQDLGFIPDVNILDAQFMGVPQRRKRVYVTWLNVDYALCKKTHISCSLALQLLTELLLLNLGERLRIFNGSFEDGVMRRVRLFSLQDENQIQKLQSYLDEVSAEGLSLKETLDESYRLMKSSAAVTIRSCLQALFDAHKATLGWMTALSGEPMELNSLEWVRYTLTETRGYINAGQKHSAGTGEVERDDVLRLYKQKFSVLSEQIERYFNAHCGREILPFAESLSGYSEQSLEEGQGAAGATEESAGAASLCLNDQGGERMDITNDVTATLRAKANHPPCVMSAGFCVEQSAQARGIGYEEEQSPTLRAGIVPATVYDNHSQDARYTGPLGTAPTVTSRYGTGGNNQPFVVKKDCFDVRLTSDGTKNARHNVYETDTARTIDTSGNSPENNQGGVAVVESYALQGSMIDRADKNGPQGSGVNENTADRHAVAYSTSKNSHHTKAEREIANTLVETDYKDPPTVAYGISGEALHGSFRIAVNDEICPTIEATNAPLTGLPDCAESYTVRRLTPAECGRLQGLPDGWAENLETENPTDDDMKFWRGVFDEWARINGTKPKSDKMIVKWLKNPYSDSAAYAMYGNGVALPCVHFVLTGIVRANTTQT